MCLACGQKDCWSLTTKRTFPYKFMVWKGILPPPSSAIFWLQMFSQHKIKFCKSFICWTTKTTQNSLWNISSKEVIFQTNSKCLHIHIEEKLLMLLMVDSFSLFDLLYFVSVNSCTYRSSTSSSSTIPVRYKYGTGKRRASNTRRHRTYRHGMYRTDRWYDTKWTFLSNYCMDIFRANSKCRQAEGGKNHDVINN